MNMDYVIKLTRLADSRTDYRLVFTIFPDHMIFRLNSSSLLVEQVTASPIQP